MSVILNLYLVNLRCDCIYTSNLLKAMEPMALGSPPSSPSGPALNPNFLPAFLMGEHQNTPRSSSLSPTKNRSVSFKPGTLDNEKTPVPQRLFPQVQEQASFNRSSINEKSGPPARGLFDTLDTRNDYANISQDNRPCFTSPIRDFEPKQGFSTPIRAQNLARNLNESLNKSARKQNDGSDSLWVTVLGFPPQAASLVFAQFSQCGTITEKKYPAEGNWIHIKYSSKLEVAKALSFNGKLISSSIMVGVIPYNNENKENITTLNDATNILSPNRARPLTQPYINQGTPTSEVLSPQNVPQKSTGLVTKAMEYVFGW